MSTSSEENKKPIMDILKDWPIGPLTKYREQASFDWRKLRISIEGEDAIRFKDRVWSFFKKHDVFSCSLETLPLDEQRKIAQRRMRVFNTGKFMSLPEIVLDPKLPGAFIESVMGYHTDMSVKYTLNYNMFPSVISGLGTERHQQYVDDINDNKISGCFALTEFSHGSNAKGMQTTATHDLKTNQFILHSSSFEAAKCWVGNLGKCATHAIVYAKLITSDGQEHGLNAFVVPIRCTKSLKPFPGVIVGDLGEKIGLNGIDNGFVIFNSYRIPADCLLNRLGDVDKNGKFVTSISDPNKRFGASLGILSGGRVMIGIMATNQLVKALVITIRYSAVRKQFGPENSDEEFSVIEYQQQQMRLFPYLAAVYANKLFTLWLSENHVRFVTDSFIERTSETPLKALEIHAVSSSSKPAISWVSRDGIQVCREACGGHGYLKAAGIGDLRNDNDANCTYEGENGILTQQTSNWLLGLWKKVNNGEKVQTPYGTVEFLNHYKALPKSLKITTSAEAVNPEVSLNAYKWLVFYYLKMTSDKVEQLSKLGKDSFSIRNDTQGYHAVSLALAFIELTILDNFYKFAQKVEDKNCKEVLMKLVSLYGAWNVEKHLGTLYMGKFLSDDAGHLIRTGIIELCSSIKPEAVALVDAICYPDFVLNSVLGNSDGMVYQHLQSSLFSSPGVFSRPNWWKETIAYDTFMPSKL